MDARAEHDRVGRDQLDQPLIAAYRRCDAGGQRWVAIGLPPHPGNADNPKSGGPRSDRDDSAPRIGQRRARQQHEKIDKAVEMVLHRHRPVRGAEGIRYNSDERQQREVAEQQRKLGPRYTDPPNPDLTPADQREQAKQRHIVKLLPCRIDNRQQAGDYGERDIARPHRQLQALLFGRCERGLRELNGFSVAPTARARQRGGQVEALDKRGHGAVSSSWRWQHSDGRQQPQPTNSLVIHGFEVTSSG